jgi:hypothetical protein
MPWLTEEQNRVRRALEKAPNKKDIWLVACDAKLTPEKTRRIFNGSTGTLKNPSYDGLLALYPQIRYEYQNGNGGRYDTGCTVYWIDFTITEHEQTDE